MFTSGDLWGGVAVPMAITAATLILGWRATRRRLGARESRSWAGPLAVGAGFAGGYWSLFGWGEFPPLDVTEWLFFLTLPLVVLGTLDALTRFPMHGRLVAGLAAALLAVSLLCWPIVATDDGFRNDTAVVVALGALLSVGCITSIEALAVRISGARLSAILLAAAVTASMTLVLSGSQRLGQTAGVLAATQAGTLAASVVLGRAAVGRATVLIFVILYAGLLLCGCGYASLTVTNALILFLAPNMAWLAWHWPDRFGIWHEALGQVALVAAVALVAVLRAWQDFAIQVSS
jgi:hypothetical protein